MSKKYSVENLKNALKDVEDGKMSIFKASKLYKIPNQTLYDKVHSKYPNNKPVGAPTVLTADEEEILVQWIMHMADMGFPVSKDLLLNSVQKLVNELDRPNKFKNGVPGRHWFEAFMRRHSTLSNRVSQSLTLSRVSVSEGILRDWFHRVKTYFTDHGMLDVLYDPTRVFNCDESAFFLCPKGQACIAKKGAKNVYSRTGNNEKENLTLLLGASADGKLMPPMAIYPYKRMPQSILNTYPRSWAIGKSESGWMTCQAFFEYITNIFNPFLIEQKIKKPAVLFLDGHVSHLSLHLSEFCKKNEIVLVALPPNSTHLMQPMDVAVFKPLKTSWSKNVYEWRMENNANRLKREDFAPLLEKSISCSLKPETIINGFRKSGLYPFSEDAINYETLLTRAASTTSSVSQSLPDTPHSAEIVVSNNINLNTSKYFLELLEERLGAGQLQIFQQSSHIWNGDIKDTNLYHFWKNAKSEASVSQSATNLSIYLGDSTLMANECTVSNINLDWPENASEMELLIDNDGTLVLSGSPGNTISSNSEKISLDALVNNVLEEAVPNPKPAFPTPFKNALLWPETPFSDKKKNVRKKLTSTVASSEEFIEYQRRLINEKEDKIKKVEERKKLRETKKAKKIDDNKSKKLTSKLKKKDNKIEEAASISVGDYVIVLYEAEKFPGQVIKILDHQFEIKTMNISTLVNGRITWRWPEKDDILVYDAEDIIKKIEPPVPLNKRGVFSVEI